MPVPLVTFGIVILRSSLRPINQILVKHFKFKVANSFGHNFFVYVGYGANNVDNYLNNVDQDPLVLKKDGKKVIKKNSISEEKAFDTGVEWFTEVVFFYGTLLGIAFYEYRKYAKG